MPLGVHALRHMASWAGQSHAHMASWEGQPHAGPLHPLCIEPVSFLIGLVPQLNLHSQFYQAQIVHYH